MTVKERKPETSKRNPNELKVYVKPGDNEAAALAQSYLRPTVHAASLVRDYNKHSDESGPDINALVAELTVQTEVASGGDLRRAEAMLLAQAHSLDAIFGNLARRAAANAGKYMGAFETYLRLGLKAQSQCRATLETLAVIKNPPNVAFVQQANIAHGPQQVNNGPAPAGDLSRAGESENQQSKLLEAQHGERLDTGKTGTASAANPLLETVEAIHWTKNSGR